MSHFLTKAFNRKNAVAESNFASEVFTLYKAQEECIVPIQQVFPHDFLKPIF